MEADEPILSGGVLALIAAIVALGVVVLLLFRGDNSRHFLGGGASPESSRDAGP